MRPENCSSLGQKAVTNHKGETGSSARAGSDSGQRDELESWKRFRAVGEEVKLHKGSSCSGEKPMKKLTERQKDEVFEFWQRTFDLFIASTPPDQLYSLKRKFEAGTVIRIVQKKDATDRPEPRR
jgi:hypothetical protein